MTFFPAVPMMRRGESARVGRNYRFIRLAKCDYVRGLAGGWEDYENWTVFRQSLGAAIDCAWEEGLRTQVTAIGGWPDAHPPKPGRGPVEVAREIVEVVSTRRDKILMLEAVNEDNASEATAIAIAKIFAPLGLPFGPGLGIGPKQLDKLKRAGKACDATVSYLHQERAYGPASDAGGKLSRSVRQCWDFKEMDGCRVANEPPGIASSVIQFTDPWRMAAMRAADLICGASAFCIHPGAGVKAAYETGTWGVRQANLDEVPGLLEMAHMTRNADLHLPAGLEAWVRFNTNKPVGIANGRCNKIYGARDGKQFAEIIIGAEQVSQLKAVTAGLVKVVNPASGAIVVEQHVGAGDVVHVPPQPDYVVIRL